MSITLEKLDEIERGCEGVTPGPWEIGAAGDYQPDSKHGPDFTPIHSDTWGAFVSVVTSTDNAGGRVGTSEQGQRNLAHIARLDPDTVRELVSLARSALSRSGEAVACPKCGGSGYIGSGDRTEECSECNHHPVPIGAPPPVPTGYKIVPEAAINALIERFAQIECQGITGQSIVTPQDLIDWTKGIAAAGYNEARAMLAASPTPKGGE
jgi:hypothetical protein